jgi:cell division protease FtsH
MHGCSGVAPHGAPGRRQPKDTWVRKNHRPRIVSALGAAGLGVGVLLTLLLWSQASKSGPAVKLPFSDFLQKVDKSPDDFKGRSITIRGGLTRTDAEFSGRLTAGDADFVSEGYLSNDLLERLRKANLEYEVVRADRGDGGWRLLFSLLPVAVVVLLFVFFMRQMRGKGGITSFGKSNARLVDPNKSKVTFADVAGVEEAKDEVEEIIAFLADPKKFTRLGGRIPKGVLLMGPPGTGKTLIARAIANEADVPFFSISGSDFVEMFVGVGASRTRDLFKQAKDNAPCIIFIDEIDAVGRQRGAGLGGGHDEREQTLNQLLVEMDGFEANEGVILIAATNRPDVLDPALLRPGRFDRRIVVSHPDIMGRLGILKVHTRKTPLGPDVDLEVIARGTPGFAGAELANLVNEAALYAGREGGDVLRMHDFEMAKDKVLMGAERRSLVIGKRDRLAMAYREAGHSLVGKMMKFSDPIHKVTIVPRGRNVGLTQQLPLEDRLSVSKEMANDQIALMMGGRVAEEAGVGDISTGSSRAVESATNLARRMVTEWGMSDKLGPLRFGDGGEALFVGRDYGSRRSHSQPTARLIDDEVRQIVLDNQARAKSIIFDNLAALRRVAEALLEFETITGLEMDALIAGEKLTRPALVPG